MQRKNGNSKFKGKETKREEEKVNKDERGRRVSREKKKA